MAAPAMTHSLSIKNMQELIILKQITKVASFTKTSMNLGLLFPNIPIGVSLNLLG